MMRSGVMVVTMVTTLAGTAMADDDCLSGVPDLSLVGTKVRACTSYECLVVTDATSKPVHAKPDAKPAPPTPPPRPVREDKGKHVACAGTTCLPAGPKLVAAAATSSWQLDISSDGLVVIVDSKPWDVVGDRPIPVPKPPKAESSDPHVFSVGRVLVATWRNCADDYNCGSGPLATIVNRTGVQLGKAFPDGKIVEVDAHHAAVVGDGRKLTTFDTDTGAQLGTIAMIPDNLITGYSLTRLDDTTVGVSWWLANGSGPTIAVVKAPGDKAPSRTWQRSFRPCPP